MILMLQAADIVFWTHNFACTCAKQATKIHCAALCLHMFHELASILTLYSNIEIIMFFSANNYILEP